PVCLESAVADREPARTGVLDDRAGRLAAIRIDREQRAFQVEEIVEGKLLSAALHQPGQPRTWSLHIESGILAGIFTVTQLLGALERHDDRLGELVAAFLGEPCGDSRVVRRRVRV